MKKIDILHGNIYTNIIRFAIPLALTGLLQQMFNAADVAVVGRFASSEAMAAVGSNTPVVGLFVNLFIGISIGSNVVISRYTGQGRADKVHKAVNTSIVFALISGLGIAIVGNLAARPIINLLGVPASVADYSVLYLRIYFAGMPFIMLYNFESAIFRSQGDTRTPLMCLTIGGILNVIANLFFVIVLGMSVDGVAVATVLANMLSSGLLFIFLVRRKDAVKVTPRELAVDRQTLGIILKIGIPSGLQSIVFSISNLCVQSAVNSLGAEAMAAGSAAFNIEIIAYFIINSFGQACTTFIGQNYGAGNNARCREIVAKAVLLGELMTVLTAVLLAVGSKQLMGIFSTDATIIALGCMRVIILMLGEPFNLVMDVLSGSMRGLGKSLTPAIVTFICVCGVRIAWAFLVFPHFGTWKSLIICYPLSWAVTAVILIVIYRYYAATLLAKRRD